MAIHSSIPSMVRESLVETFLVSEYCIKFQKDPNIWKSNGCYGYPASKLLFSIVDTIGSYVIGINPRKHFDILSHPDYYNLELDEKSIKIIYENYRSTLEHNSAMPLNHILDIGNENDKVFEIVNGCPRINLISFLILSEHVLGKFLPESEKIISGSKKIQDILKK